MKHLNEIPMSTLENSIYCYQKNKMNFDKKVGYQNIAWIPNIKLI